MKFTQSLLDTELKKFGLKRGDSLYKVGKSIGGSIYVHKKYENQFPKEQLEKAKSKLPAGFKYTIVKYTPKSGDFSFILSRDFDSNEEPSVNGGIVIRDGGVKEFGDNGWIYHHKWMFVGDDYRGFDVDKSKKRSLEWLALKNIDKSRIGQRDYWNKNVVNKLEEDGSFEDRSLPKGEITKRLSFLKSRLRGESGEDAVETRKEIDYYNNLLGVK